MSTGIAPPVRGRGWVFQVTALCIVLGMLLALALRTQRQAASDGIPNRYPILRTEFANLKQQNGKLQKDLADYKAQYEDLMRKRGAMGSETVDLLNQMKLLAGTVALRGPGVIITLHDSPKREFSETSRPDVVENYIVHDSDIRAVTNELYAAGAEAISVNGQRLVASSSIRCVGPVVLINNVQVAPPYAIKAIGDPDVLQKALEMQGGVADGLFLLDMIEVKRQPELTVPAYSGSTRLNLAQPVPQGRTKG